MNDRIAELRTLYAQPTERAQRKEIRHLDAHCRRFIALSPFVVLASADDANRCDASPRGGDPGFVKVIDDTTLLIPDAPGNNRLDTLQNIQASGRHRPAVPRSRCRRNAARQRPRARLGRPRADPPVHDGATRAEGGDRGARRGGLPALRQGADALQAVERREPRRALDAADDGTDDRGSIGARHPGRDAGRNGRALPEGPVAAAGERPCLGQERTEIRLEPGVVGEQFLARAGQTIRARRRVPMPSSARATFDGRHTSRASRAPPCAVRRTAAAPATRHGAARAARRRAPMNASSGASSNSASAREEMVVEHVDHDRRRSADARC